MGTLFTSGKQDSNRASGGGAPSHGAASDKTAHNKTGHDAASPDGGYGFFAREQISRQGMVRLSLWGAAGVGALVVAILASNATMSARRMDQAAEQQVAGLKRAAEDADIEARRLSAAIRTLNGDRDRLYTRLTVVEKNLEDVTGAVSKQAERQAANAGQAGLGQAATGQTVMGQTAMGGESGGLKPPQIAPAASAAASNVAGTGAATTPAGSDPSLSSAAGAASAANSGKPTGADANLASASNASLPPMPQPRPAPLAAADGKSDPLTTASTNQQDGVKSDEAKPESVNGGEVAISTFETNGFGAPAFGADLGGAKSIAAMRSFWRSMTRKYPALLDKAQPLMALRERKNGLGMELRLIAGPIKDESLATSLCHKIEKAGHQSCLVVLYDGQRIESSSASVTPAAMPAPNAKIGNAKPEQDKTNVNKTDDDKSGSDRPAASIGASADDEAKSARPAAKRTRTERTARAASEPARNAPAPAPAPASASRSPLEQLFSFGR